MHHWEGPIPEGLLWYSMTINEDPWSNTHYKSHSRPPKSSNHVIEWIQKFYIAQVQWCPIVIQHRNKPRHRSLQVPTCDATPGLHEGQLLVCDLRSSWRWEHLPEATAPLGSSRLDRAQSWLGWASKNPSATKEPTWRDPQTLRINI